MQASVIKVLICDDSALIRRMLVTMLDSDPMVEVVGTAANPHIARTMIKDLNPDVLTLDIEMPEMDGLTFLEKIMTLRPMPVVMISSLTQKGAAQTLRAMELGVVDVIGKPTMNLAENFTAMQQEILQKVKAAAKAHIRPLAPQRERVIKKEKTALPQIDLIALGASTGGVVALKEIVPLMPANIPPIVITQHMPGTYTNSFSKRLDGLSRINVVEAEDGMVLKAGHTYIAPGERHMRISGKPGRYVVHLSDDDLISGHRPSVDALFRSIASDVKGKVLACILTGMGRDGAAGMLALRKNGAVTVGQDEDSCTVYGMPRVAYQVGGVEQELPLSKIASFIEKKCWP